MKLQYLGDSRDAFKWDLLHWLITNSNPAFERVAYIPMLTPDDLHPAHGRTPHSRFKSRSEVRDFVIRLGEEPRSLDRVREFGILDPSRRFEVVIQESSDQRSHDRPNSLVFFDPDNGFETKTQRGSKWLRHAVLQRIVSELPDSGAVVVYQHRPRLRAWPDVFSDLATQLAYAPFACAVRESNLGFVLIANERGTAERLIGAVSEYGR
jgi:hypothetical protein